MLEFLPRVHLYIIPIYISELDSHYGEWICGQSLEELKGDFNVIGGTNYLCHSADPFWPIESRLFINN